MARSQNNRPKGPNPADPQAKKKQPAKFNEKQAIELLRDHDIAPIIARDELTMFDMLLWPLPNWDYGPHPRPWLEEDTTALLQHLQGKGAANLKLGTLKTVLPMLASENRYNPIADRLHALPPWDGKKRLDEFLPRALGLDMRDTEMAQYHRAVSKRTVWAIVSRALQPGCKFDCMPILEGGQGIGKSRFCRLLAFGEDAWFTDSLPPITGVMIKDAREQLMGRMIVEMSELAQFKGSHNETLKSFLSSSSDTVRLPYATRSGLYPRCCIIIGTTNEGQYLSDTTGNRRFWPVRCGDIDLLYADEVLDQVYAEALHDWKRAKELGVQLELWMPPHIEILAGKQQEARREPDPLEDELRQYIEQRYQQEAGATGASYPGHFFVSPKSFLEDYEHESVIAASDGRTNARLQKIGRLLAALGGWPKPMVPMWVWIKSGDDRRQVQQRRNAYRFDREFTPETPHNP